MSNQAPRTRNFKTVIKGGNFLKPLKWEEWTEGDFVEGEYVNASELDLYGKPIYEIKVEDSKFSGVNPTKDGICPLYSNGSLNMQMDNASYGDVVRVTYQGMAVTSKGKFKGKPCHNIKVEIDGYVDPEEAATAGDDDLLG